VVVAPASIPRAAVARRELAGVASAYVLALSLLAALAAAPPPPAGVPDVPEVEWIAVGSVGALASAAARAFGLGFLYAFGRPRRHVRARDLWRVAALGTLAVSAAELVRWLSGMPVRAVPLAVGAAAGLAGAWCHRATVGGRRGAPRHGEIGAVAPFELPLAGAALLLMPAVWLVAGAGDRLALVALGTCFGASLLTSARLSRGPAAGGVLAHGLGVGLWASAASVPAWLARPAEMAVVIAGVTLFATVHAALPTPDATGRRYEGPAVRRALPLFVVFLAVSAVHPLPETLRAPARAVGSWGWGSGGARGALEHAAAFVVLGFVLAELRGRRDEPVRAAWRWVGPWGAAAAGAVEALRALHPAHAAGVTRAVVAVLGVRLGVAIYACHRDHVRARRGLAGGERPVGARDAAPAPRAVGAHALRPRGRRRGT
jgi:hypothetical protein